MLFTIHCLDGGDRSALRAAHIEAHWAYLRAAPLRLVMGGPLLSDDGQTALGSLMVVEAEDRAAVEAFSRSDPFRRTGVWQEVRIHPFLKRWDDRAGAEA